MKIILAVGPIKWNNERQKKKNHNIYDGAMNDKNVVTLNKYMWRKEKTSDVVDKENNGEQVRGAGREYMKQVDRSLMYNKGERKDRLYTKWLYLTAEELT